VTIFEGESLVNDATALVAYRFAVAAVVAGVFSFGEASLQFVLVSVGGSPWVWPPGGASGTSIAGWTIHPWKLRSRW
jgi:hypothetical protein